MVMLTDRPMRKVKYFTYKESEMNIVLLEMNGDKVSKTLNYLPAGRGWYNCVVKGEKQSRFSSAEETLEYLQSRQDEQITMYVKVPSTFHALNLAQLRIA